jgi:hypothetical protein
VRAIGRHGITSQKIELFITTSVRTSIPNRNFSCLEEEMQFHGSMRGREGRVAECIVKQHQIEMGSSELCMPCLTYDAVISTVSREKS